MRLDHRLFPREGQLNPLLRRSILPDCSSVLDVGCGDQGALPTRVPGIPHLVGIDLIVPEPGSPERLHDAYHEADIRSIGELFEPASFDCVVGLDVIEHLARDEGLRLLEDMERIARRRVIVFTPNGFLSQRAESDNPHQEHVSGWEVADFESRGFAVTGVNGWKPLRGEYASIRWRPQMLWWRLSVLSQWVVASHPRWAFQLFARKEVGAT